MAINKVEYGQKTLIDLTSDTVTKETLVKGTSAHNAAGEQIEGVFDPTEYLKKSGGDAKDVVSTFSSSDTDDSVSEWTSVSVLSSGEKLSSLFNKISTMFRNIRYLYKLIGSTDISELSEDGTITKSLTTLNGKLMRMRNLAFTTDNMGEYIIGQKIIPIFMTTNNSEYYPKFEFYNYNNDIKVRVTNFSSAEYKIIPDVYFNCNLYYFDI